MEDQPSRPRDWELRFDSLMKDISLKFSLQNVIELTTFIAIFLALGSIPYSGPAICILFAHIGAAGSVVLLGFWAILTGKANGMQLETTTPALNGILLRFAAFSALIVASFWLVIIGGWGYNFIMWTISRI